MSKNLRIPSIIVIYCMILSVFLVTAIAGNKAITAINENTPLVNRKCIIIDAGHGGVDGGATSCTGVLESSINLEIALRMNDLLHLLGFDTLMIRTTDVSVYREGESIAAKKISDLKERVRIVNETPDAILISIHQNFFSDSRYSGAQVFYSNTQNSAILAKNLQTSLVKALNPNSNRKAKRADGVYLMDNIERTGVLIECGFLSNPAEEANLRNEAYQKDLCCVIASVISVFTQNNTIA